MPQIDQLTLTYMSQIFWLVVVFALIYFGIAKTMLPKVEQTVEARTRRIADDLAAAERARAKADADEEAWRSRLSTARAEALKATQQAKTAAAIETEGKVKAADTVLSGKTAEAEAKILHAQRQALAGIEEAAVDAARDIVAKLSGAQVSEAAAAEAVKAALAARG